jgi:hypothetical protein
MAKNKRPTDINQRAKMIVDISTGAITDTLLTPDGKNAAAVALGKLGGGAKGGAARAKSLTAKRRSEIAKKAASARWKKK